MPAEVASSSGASLRSKPTTRSSIRQSFGLSSVGKALADVMHKDSKENDKDREKASKKKDAAHRRTSAINLAPPSRPSTDKPPARKLTEDSPEAKTITRHSRRQSALKKLAPPPDEPSSSPSDSASPKGSISARSSVRNRNSLVGSGLPKYRPRSMLGESAIPPPKKSTSPSRQSSRRRRLSSSDDETDEVKTPKDSLEVTPVDKSARSISPLPHRGALKVNLTSAINVRAATPDKKDKGTPQPKGSPASIRTTSTKASKVSKTSTPVSGTNSGSVRSGLPRPPSSASSVSASSRTPNTPPTPTLFGNILKGSNSLRLNVTNGGSPLRGGLPAPPESPLGRVSARKNGSSKSGFIHMRGASVPATPTPRVISEESSMDSIDADDVEFMLGSVASPSAPTPAIPRILRTKSDDDPHTPSRPGFLPSRANLSYQSPAAPSSTDNSPFLRPKARHPGNDRGSILSWEQLAQHSKSLDDEDVERMISEIPAPFRSGAVSPSLSVIDIPDSPNLSTLPSPTAYGSISQVLLPDVTPSPAIHNTTHLFDNMKHETPTADSGAVTLLRLQLAAAENRAQERLMQMQSLEEQLHAAKAARMRDAEELSRQIAELEQQVHSNLLVESQRSEQIAVLEEMLRDAQAAQDKSVKEAARKAEDALCVSKAAALQTRQLQARSEITLAAREARSAWFCVRETAESELELVRGNREMLSLLLAGLDHSLAQLSRV